MCFHSSDVEPLFRWSAHEYSHSGCFRRSLARMSCTWRRRVLKAVANCLNSPNAVAITTSHVLILQPVRRGADARLSAVSDVTACSCSRHWHGHLDSVDFLKLRTSVSVSNCWPASHYLGRIRHHRQHVRATFAHTLKQDMIIKCETLMCSSKQRFRDKRCVAEVRTKSNFSFVDLFFADLSFSGRRGGRKKMVFPEAETYDDFINAKRLLGLNSIGR